MTISVAFIAKNPAGVPLAGLTPTWLGYYNAVSGASISSPSFTALGGGNYCFTPIGSNPCGMIDLGGSATPRFLAYASLSTVFVFAAYDVTGFPLTGLTNTWTTLKKVSDATDASQPAITAIGNGLYKANYLPDHSTGTIDMGATAYPRYTHYDSEPYSEGVAEDAANPVVTIVSLPVLNTDPAILQIYDETSLALYQLTCQDHAEAPRYVVYDAENGFYHPFGGRSTVSGSGTQVSPYVFTIYRRGRWPTDISLDFRAVCVDSSGNYVNTPATFDTEEAPIV